MSACRLTPKRVELATVRRALMYIGMAPVPTLSSLVSRAKRVTALQSSQYVAYVLLNV